MNELTPTMQDAISYAKQHGNKLVRYPGGFWCAEGKRQRWFGTVTIDALVDRGVAEYTQWKEREGRLGFPIEVTLKEVGAV